MLKIGKLPTGSLNAITDVNGVRVGHFTLSENAIQTGITVILPHEGNIFKEKLVAASHIINGFGKSIGLVQVDELGTIESPIALTNTFAVGRVATGLIQHMLDQNPEIGLSTGTINPLVFECNDGLLNDIRGLHIKEMHVPLAIENAQVDFEQGAVGAGTGMCTFSLKGGIGSSSRVVKIDDRDFTVGVLILSNFGRLSTLTIDGEKTGEHISGQIEKESSELMQNARTAPDKEKGSMIAVIATDVPMNDRQLKRLCKRVPAGMARTGAYFGNGSGDIVLSFSTATKIPHDMTSQVLMIPQIHENAIDTVFSAVIEATEEAILKSMFHAKTVKGRKERVVKSITEYL